MARPLGDGVRVASYLARYVHRVAISNERIMCLNDDRVTSGRLQPLIAQ